MQSRRSIPPSKGDRSGFSLMELVVALGMTGVAMGAATSFFIQQAQTFAHQAYRLETQQALRASLDNITRDLRLAGACLPSGGAFTALAGVNDPDGDSVTIRTGIVGPNGSCLATTLAASPLANAGSTTITVANAAGFTAGMLLYLRNPNGSGETRRIISISGNVLTLEAGLEQSYLRTDAVCSCSVSDGGVYPMDERIYALDKSAPEAPLLTLEANRGGPLAFAVGVHDLQVQYILDDNCPSCEVVDLPADDAEWATVNEVTVTATVRAVGSARAGDDTAFVASARAKPRNLLP
jgi:hypothetical protein